MVLGKVVLVEQGLLACWMFIEIEGSESTTYVLWIYKEGRSGMLTYRLCMASTSYDTCTAQTQVLFKIVVFPLWSWKVPCIYVSISCSPYRSYSSIAPSLPPILLVPPPNPSSFSTSCPFIVINNLLRLFNAAHVCAGTATGSHPQRRVNLLPSAALEMRLTPLPHPCGIVTGLIMRR